MKKNHFTSYILPKICMCVLLVALSASVWANNRAESSDTANTMQQTTRKIKGRVIDPAGEAVIGASVVEKGTTNGIVTDLDGAFELTVPAKATLLVSFVGYKTVEIPVGDKADYNIVLQEDNQVLNEVVVVGYGTQKKLNLTGAVDMVTSEVLENRPMSNLSQGLQGAIPNVQLTFADGKPTRSSGFQVRGTGSIGQGGNALVLIDGVEGDPSMLNPSDVASVSVLKDASAAAIYGARATYGVVLITTKDPNKDKVQVSYNGNFIMKSPTVVPEVLTDPVAYTDYYMEAIKGYQNSIPSKFHSTLKITDAWLQNLRGGATGVVTESNGKYSYYGSTDWYDLLYKDQSTGHEHNLNVQGGGEKANFLVSGRFYAQDGIFNFDPDKYKTFNIRAKGNVKVTEWLKVSNNFEFSQMEYHNPMNVGEGSVWYALESEGQPLNVLFNPDNSLTWAGATILGSFVCQNNYQDSTKRVLRNTTGFTANIWKNRITVNGDVTFRYDDNAVNGVQSPVPYKTGVNDAVQYTGSSYDAIYNSKSTTKYLATNIYAQYAQVFGVHDVKAMVGYNYEQSIYDYGFMHRASKIYEGAENINLTTGSTTISSSYNKWRIAGGFFRTNYAFNDRYLVEFSGRYDGSSKFPTNSQWKFFPSASAGWRISQEPWWKVDAKAISNLKIRASYGSLGNGNINPYAFQELFSFSQQQRIINGQKNLSTSAPSPIPEGLTWETSTTTNFGGDFAFLNDRLTLSADYYIRKTTDMYVTGTPLPAVYGASAPKGNYADMTTRGWEVTLTWRDKLTLADKPFSYEIKGTLADAKSKIDKFPNDEMTIGGPANTDIQNFSYYGGMTLGEIWGFVNDGYYTADDFDADGKLKAGLPDQSFVFNNTMSEWAPGDIKFKDLNGDGKIDFGNSKIGDTGDRKVIGNKLPRYTFSLNMSGNWNGIFASLFFQGVGKQNWWPGGDNSMFWGQYSRPYSNIPTSMIGNWWTEDNTDAYWPRYRGYIAHQGNRTLHIPQSKYLQNVAYIRLKNVQIGYNFPKELVNKIHLQALKVYASAENLWCWSPMYKHSKQFDVNSINGEDSETKSLINDGYYKSPIMSDGGSTYSYPILKSITFGLGVTF